MVVQADLGIRVRLYSQNKYRKGWQCDSSDRAPACQAMSSNPNTTKSKKGKAYFGLRFQSVIGWFCCTGACGEAEQDNVTVVCAGAELLTSGWLEGKRKEGLGS
jgi:hypothetical protein